MSNWILIAIVGYFFLSLEAVLSKFLITGKIKSWKTYSFYVGIFSSFALVLIPWRTTWTNSSFMGISLIAGALQFISLAFLFKALETSAASRVYLLYGAASTITTFVLANFLVKENLTFADLFGISLLIIGGFFISFKFYKMKFFHNYRATLWAGFLAGFSLVFLKYIYEHHNFINGYICSRIGLAGMAFSFLLHPKFRRAALGKIIIAKKYQKQRKEKFFHLLWTIFAKSIAGIGTILTGYAVSLGSVTIVNALSSAQYLFTFILITLLAFHFKKFFQEEITFSNLLTKSIGALLIIGGIIFISFR